VLTSSTTAATTAVFSPVLLKGTKWESTVSSLTTGTYTVTVTATDLASNITTTSQVIAVDQLAPVLTISPVSTPTKTATQVITGTIGEPGITPVVTVNTGATVGTVTVSGGVWSVQINNLKPGTNNITVSATDAVGNNTVIGTSIVLAVSDGCFNSCPVTVLDALKALYIAVGLVAPTPNDMLHGDVAPLKNGIPNPDGRIDNFDSLLILKKAIGLINF